MNTKLVIIVLVVLGVLGIGGYYVLSQSSGNNQTATRTTSPATNTTTTTTTTAPTDKNLVTLTADGFSPSTLTIKAGETVTWINKSGTDGAVYSVPHPIHTAYPPLNLGTFSNGATLSLTFNQAGSYGYHNHLNPSQTGTIVVQ